MTSSKRFFPAAWSLSMLLCIAGVLSACGDTPNDREGLDEPPEEDTYCLLQVGMTTLNDARDILGMETNATHSQTVTMLIYRYGLATDGTFAVLQFDQHDVFFGAVLMGVPFPRCWTADLQQKGQGVVADPPSEQGASG